MALQAVAAAMEGDPDCGERYGGEDGFFCLNALAGGMAVEEGEVG
jgi:hypothetical protein